MTSPLGEVLVASGGQYVGEPATASPAHFGNPFAEYDAAHKFAAIMDRSSLSKLELRGPDRVKFLHNLCTNDIKSLAACHGCEAYFTNAHGKILAQVRLFAEANSHWIDTVPGSSATLFAHLERYHIMEKVDLADRTNDFAQVILAGPRACEIVMNASGTPAASLRNLQHAPFNVDGAAGDLIYHELLGIPAFELRVPAEHAVQLWKRIWQAGQPAGLRPMGDAAFEMLRIEAGLPVYGADVTDANLPQEVGRIDRTTSFTKGCYLGQETVARIDALGHVNRHLVGLMMRDLRESPPAGSSILAGEKPVGHVTSACFSPALDCAIALGYVRRGFERRGTELIVDSSGLRIPASVQLLPFRA